MAQAVLLLLNVDSYIYHFASFSAIYSAVCNEI